MKVIGKVPRAAAALKREEQRRYPSFMYHVSSILSLLPGPRGRIQEVAGDFHGKGKDFELQRFHLIFATSLGASNYYYHFIKWKFRQVFSCLKKQKWFIHQESCGKWILSRDIKMWLESEGWMFHFLACLPIPQTPGQENVSISKGSLALYKLLWETPEFPHTTDMRPPGQSHIGPQAVPVCVK